MFVFLQKTVLYLWVKVPYSHLLHIEETFKGPDLNNYGFFFSPFTTEHVQKNSTLHYSLKSINFIDFGVRFSKNKVEFKW